MLGECLYIPFSMPQIAIYFPMTKETLVLCVILLCLTDGQTVTVSEAHTKKSGSKTQDIFFLTKKEEDIFFF